LQEPDRPTGASTDRDERDATLIRYVREALERRDRGQEVDIEEICAANPSMVFAVAEALGIQSSLSDIQRASTLIDPMLGSMLNGRYEIIERAGHGGMGIVYRAVDLELGRSVAVKLMQAVHEDATERFLREAKALAAFEHEHVVPIYDFGRTEAGQLFLVLQHLRGASLADVLRQSPRLDNGPGPPPGIAWLSAVIGAPPPSRKSCLQLYLSWLADIAKALRHAHGSGLYHRDVKPANIFIDESYKAVLIDFGLVKRQEDIDSASVGSAVGTPPYMAPEQIHGRGKDPQLLDVYGLTATFYHMLAGRPPYEGRDVDVQISRGETPPPIHKLNRHVHRDLRAIIEHGMAFSPKQRYPTMADLEADLRAVLEHRPVSVRPLSTPVRLWRAARRRPQRAALILVSVAALLLTGIVIPLWSTWSAKQRREKAAALVATIPARLCIEGWPDKRMAVSLSAERRKDIELLTQILDLDPHDLRTLLLRSALRLDDGDPTGAAEDLKRLSELARTPYLRAVAVRYSQAVASNKRGVLAVDLDGLPEPTSPADHFVAGFHELRNRHVRGFARRALAHLTAAMESYIPARDLRLLALLGVADGSPRKEKDALCREAYEQALILEGIYGNHKTARTRSVMGTALLLQREYGESITYFEQSLSIRPGRHGPYQNLGVAYRRLRDYANAKKYLKLAASVRPEMWNTNFNLALVLSEEKDVENALAVARRVEHPQRPWFRHSLIGNIYLQQAFFAEEIPDEDAVREFATLARGCFDTALKILRRLGARSSRIENSRSLAEYLRSNDVEQAWFAFLESVSSEPSNPTNLWNLADMLPRDGLSSSATRRLRVFIKKLSKELAPQLKRMRK